MRRPAALLQRWRASVRKVPAAGAAALVMLLQTLLVGPLAVSMMLAGEPAGEATVAQSGHHHHGPAGGAPAAPGRHHHHESCLICQGAVAPTLAAVVALPAAPDVFSVESPLAPPKAAKPQPAAHAYRSRAPPPGEGISIVARVALPIAPFFLQQAT